MRNLAFSRSNLRTLQCNCVLLNRLNSGIGNDSLATLKDRCDTDFLPLDRNLHKQSQVFVASCALKSRTPAAV